MPQSMHMRHTGYQMFRMINYRTLKQTIAAAAMVTAQRRDNDLEQCPPPSSHNSQRLTVSCHTAQKSCAVEWGTNPRRNVVICKYKQYERTWAPPATKQVAAEMRSTDGFRRKSRRGGWRGCTICHQFMWTAARIPNDAPVKFQRCSNRLNIEP